MIDLKWETVEKETGYDILVSRINESTPNYNLSIDNCQIKVADIPFYSELLLLRIEKTLPRQHQPLYFIANDEKMFFINGNKEVFDEINKFNPPEINDETVLDYFYLYIESLSASEGNFKIIKDWRDIALGSNATKDNLCEMSEKIIHPFVEYNEDKFTVQATILYANDLFNLSADIHSDGSVFLKNEEPVISSVAINKHMMI